MPWQTSDLLREKFKMFLVSLFIARYIFVIDKIDLR